MALQANPETLRWGASTFAAAGDAIQGNVESIYNRIVNLIENSQDGWIGDGASAFVSRLDMEVERFRNAADVLRQVPPILTYLATEMEEIIALRRRADELEAEAQSILSHAGPLDVGARAEAAWLITRAEALRIEADAKAELADWKGAAEILGIDMKQMATDFWNSGPMVFVRHEVGDAVTWMEDTVTGITSDVELIGGSVGKHPLHFVNGVLTSVGKAMSFGLWHVPEPGDPDEAYEVGRVVGDAVGAVGGSVMMVGGAVGEVAGVALDATGIGALVGVGINVAAATATATGYGITKQALSNYGNDLNQMFAKMHEGGDGGAVTNEGTGNSWTHPTVENPNFPSPEALQNHFDKHVVQQGEFGNMTEEQYMKDAQSLVSSEPGGDIVTKTRSNGDTLYYNKANNEFAVKTINGVIRTFFKPSNGVEYFNQLK